MFTDPQTEKTRLERALDAAAARIVSGACGIAGLKRLSGGASQETWAFDALMDAGAPVPLILRRVPGGIAGVKMGTGVALATEAAVIRACAKAGVPVPQVPYVMVPEDDIGEAYVMTRIDGETIARKILRDPAYEAARPKLARQCGAILARLHAVPLDHLPPLDTQGARLQWSRYREIYDGFTDPRPVFEYAFRWLEERLPDDAAPRLVHGDFRNGNLMIGPDGVRAVLDWELTHLGDPMEDLGWICVNSWRFGVSHNPVGGFGPYEELFTGYEEAGGGSVDRQRVRFWEVFGTLKWGIMCMIMAETFRSGADRTVERATIGRRSSETEIDLVNMLVIG